MDAAVWVDRAVQLDHDAIGPVQARQAKKMRCEQIYFKARTILESWIQSEDK